MANQTQNKTPKQPHKRRNADPPARYAFRHPAEKQKNEANHGKTTKTTRNTATATTRKSPGQICVSPAEKTAKQHKMGPEPHQTKNHTIHGDCLRHDRIKPTVLIRTNELKVCGPKQINGGEAKQL